MRRITDIHELRSIQMGILDHVHDYCERHGLRYFLSSGTLIGAVRHKGYIPWDDDIDIYMPRQDYEQFLRDFLDETGHFRILAPSPFGEGGGRGSSHRHWRGGTRLPAQHCQLRLFLSRM